MEGPVLEQNDFVSLKIAVFIVCGIMLRSSVKKANTLPNQYTEFDKRSVSNQKQKRAKPMEHGEHGPLSVKGIEGIALRRHCKY